MATFTPSEMDRIITPARNYGSGSAMPLKLAGAAALAAIALDYPLTQKYPLKDEQVSVPTRLLVTGSLVFASVLVAAYFVKE
jgi:hypothetical protein